MIGFGEFSPKQAKATITTLTDTRLVRIDPQEQGFFNAVRNFKSTNDAINTFIEAVDEVRAAKLAPFYKPIYDPSEDGKRVTYKKGKEPAVGHSYNWWVETASKMPAVEGRSWKLTTEYQYYAFLVWLINQLVKSGKSVEEAMNQVVLDSRELGHYYDSENSTEGGAFELTGSRCICGLYDLANTIKILECSNEEAGGFWLAGGSYDNNGNDYPLADLDHRTAVDYDGDDGVGLLVL